MNYIVVFSHHTIAGALLNPIDVVKIRMQNSSSLYVWNERGVIAGFQRILREEGIAGMTRGLTATILRELLYSTIRMGAYEPILRFLSPNDNKSSSPSIKYLSALLSGGIGAAIANPTDLVKVKIQSASPTQSLPFTSTFSGFVYIFQVGGIRGLYRGATPTIARAAVLTSAQVGSYDTIKNNILKDSLHISEGLHLYFFTSLLTGLITTTASNPGDGVLFDVI